MAFIAECPFCRVKVQKVPDQREGDSTECPRCHNLFTLAAMIIPPKLRPSSPNIAVPNTSAIPAPALAHASAVGSATHGTLTVSGDGTEPKTPAVLPVTPVKTTPRVDEEVVTVSAAMRSPFTHPDEARVLGVTAFFLTSLAVCTATLLHLYWVTLGVGGLAVVCAVVALAAAPKRKGVPALPLYALILSVAVVGLTFVWPSLLGFQPKIKDLTEGGGKIMVIPSLDRTKANRPPAEQTQWVDASDGSIEHEGLRIQIVSAVLKAVETVDANGKKSTKERQLLLKLRITSIGVTQTLEYTSWGEPGPASAVLKDNHGRSYQSRSYGMGVGIAGHVARASLAPGKAIDDVLVYPLPGDDIESFRLELPGAALRVKASFRFEIPRKMIK